MSPVCRVLCGTLAFDITWQHTFLFLAHLVLVRRHRTLRRPSGTRHVFRRYIFPTHSCLLPAQGPEIRTGFLKNPDQPIKLTAGKEISVTTDYDVKGDDNLISMR